MSSSPYTPTPREERGAFDYDYDDSRGQGLVTFAGVMLMIAAVLNSLYGIAAIDKANVFVNDARYVFGDLSTWGWFVLALGVLQFFAALAIWRGRPGHAGSASRAPAPTRSCRRSGSPPIRCSR
jgi:hypothetical protein